MFVLRDSPHLRDRDSFFPTVCNTSENKSILYWSLSVSWILMESYSRRQLGVILTAGASLMRHSL